MVLDWSELRLFMRPVDTLLASTLAISPAPISSSPPNNIAPMVIAIGKKNLLDLDNILIDPPMCRLFFRHILPWLSVVSVLLSKSLQMMFRRALSTMALLVGTYGMPQNLFFVLDEFIEFCTTLVRVEIMLLTVGKLLLSSSQIVAAVLM